MLHNSDRNYRHALLHDRKMVIAIIGMMRVVLWILGLAIIIGGFWVWRTMAATIGAGAAWPWLLLTILAAVVVIGMATNTR